MDHVAIMSVKIPFLERILIGEKTIESRWYSQKRAPWNRVAAGDWLYFKDVAKSVTLKAQVAKVRQYEFSEPQQVVDLVEKSSLALGLRSQEIDGFIERVKLKRYAIFIDLQLVTAIAPFYINKRGFGSMSAWITVPDIKQIAQFGRQH